MKKSILNISITIQDENGNITEQNLEEIVPNAKVENIDDLEELLLSNGYDVFRGIMSKQLENLSKKKPLKKEKK